MKITGIILSVFLTAGFLWADHDERIGGLYLKEAAFLYEAGDYDETARLIKTAGEFLSENSDMLYLKGCLGMIAGGSIRKPEFFFREALEADNWKIYSPVDWGKKYIPILYRTGEYASCLEFLSDPDFNPNPSEDFIRMHVRSLIELDRRADAVDVVKEGLAFYPESGALYELLFEIAPGEKNRYSGLLMNGTINHPALKNVLIPVLITGLEEYNPALFELYDESGVFDLESEIKRISLSGLEDIKELENLAARGLFFDGRICRSLIKSLPFNYQRDEVKKLFSDWSGVMNEDVNDDNYPEAEIEVTEGKITGVIWDPDQDGENDLEIKYENEVPVSAFISENSRVLIEYELYPWVKRITRGEGDRISVYSLILGNFSFPLPSVDPLESEWDFVKSYSDWDEIRDNSRNVLVYSPGWESPLEEYVPLFNRGGKTFEYSRGDNGFNRTYYLRNGILEFEEQDLTESPDWDTVRYYQEGLLRLIAHDSGEDGTFEYAEGESAFQSEGEYSGESGWYLWDFNQNGYYDCRERRLNGIILREYSSLDNGNYDILIEIEDNR